MKKLDQYLVKSFVGPFFAILLIVEFVLMMQFLWVYIDELVGKGLQLSVIMEFMGWGGTTLLPLSLPLATLLAGVMTIGQFSENSELIAMKSAGISLARIMLPLVIVSVMISIGAFFAANNLVPHAYNKIYTLRNDIIHTNKEINIPEGTFYDGIEGYTLRITSRNRKTGMMYGVQVYDHTGGKGSTAETLADSAMLAMSKNKDYLVFSLYDGISYQEDNKFRYRDTTMNLQRLRFSEQQMIIPLKNYAFEKTKDAQYSDQVNSRRLSQLRVDKDSLDHCKDSVVNKQLAAYASDRNLRYNNQLDTSFHKAKFAIDMSTFGQWRTRSEEIRAYEGALSAARNKKSSLKGASADVLQYDWTLRRTDIRIFKKFAGALACLIMFLIGAPLGAFVNRKTGLGASAIIAVLFFVVYWVVDISGEKLAKDGATSAFMGAFISSLVLLPAGVFLSWKAVKDSALFSSEGPLAMWRKAKAFVMNIFRKTRIVYFGTPEFAVAPLEALLNAKYKVVGVVTVADKPVGRGQQLAQSAVKKFAVAHDIPVLQPHKLKDPEFLAQLKALRGDIFVVVAFRMLPEEVWAMPPMGTFNLHAALLPQYRGAAPINWAIINGERISGVTTFMIDKDIDTGKIILRQECRISETDTAGDLHDRLMPIGSELVLTTVQGLIEKSVETRVQRSFIQGSEVLKPAPKLSKELCHIDWDAPTTQVYNLIRGLSPYPAAWTGLTAPDGTVTQLKIYATRRNMDLRAEPGTVLSDGKDYFAIATADGALEITDLQLSGKKRMDVKAFLAGFRSPEQFKADKGTSAQVIAQVRG